MAGRIPMIRTEGLTKSFEGRVVVNKIDIEVQPREIFALIGPNGAGKSTLVKMLTTPQPPTSGDHASRVVISGARRSVRAPASVTFRTCYPRTDR